MATRIQMYRIEENVEAVETGTYGESLFARRDFQKDDVVFVAFGPIVRTATRFTIPIDHEIKIDPTRPRGNLCQYICHSCNPNLGIRHRTFFVALRNIARGEEVVVDYAMLGYDYGVELSEPERTCRCGAATCRGRLGSYKDLPDELRRKYAGYISDYLLDGRYNP